MAAVTRALVALMLLGGCGDLAGFGGEVPALATVQVRVTGDFEAVRVPDATDEDLRVALVWGAQWLPEPLCFLPPESPEVEAVVAAGCRNPFAFTPDRVTVGVPITPDVPAALPLFALPSAEVMVGDVTARVAYASLVVYDDRDRSGTLELGRTPRLPAGGFDDEMEVVPRTRDLIYGASFVAMTEPDTRLAFREGGFIETAFYPRHGCGVPPPAFSILSASGFSIEAAIAATAAGMLPSQDPARCAEADPDDAIVVIPLRPPAEVTEAACEQRRRDSSVRYRQPPVEAPDLEERVFACASIPSFGGDTSTDGIIQLVVASRSDDYCRGLTHYTLIGCDEGGLVCDAPEWDFRAAPPAWWPCPTQATR